MKTNKEIVTEIIEDLENTLGLNWPKRSVAKVNRERLIECWSEYRKDPDWKYYGYTNHSSLSELYKKLFQGLIKQSNKQSWKVYIFNLYNYKYCSKCKSLQELVEFSNSNAAIDNKQPVCKSCSSISRKEYYKINKETENISSSKYKKEHRAQCNATNTKRQAAKLNRTPSWLTKQDFKDIEKIYVKAKELELQDGIKYHVDHIIPLQGRLVSGLHVPSNLQILTSTENLSKSNTY